MPADLMHNRVVMLRPRGVKFATQTVSDSVSASQFLM
jgi:hypothetical protein